MKVSYLLLYFLLFLGISSYAQLDKGKSKSSNKVLFIPSKKPIIKPKKLSLDNNTGFKTAFKKADDKVKAKEKETKELNKGIYSKEQYRKERYEKLHNEINKKYAKVDQHLGDFRTNSKFVIIKCRDFQHPDNDRVTIYVNGVPVVYNIRLERNYQTFKIPLEKGLNKIAFRALNQGTSGPNTAGFLIIDDSNAVISKNEWNLATGAKATILIAKDK